MAEAQDLHDVLARPFPQSTAIGSQFRLKLQGSRSRPFARPSDPQPATGRRMQRPPADAVVAQDAVARPAGLDPQRRLETKLFECSAFFERETFHFLKLDAVVEGENPAFGPVALAIGRPVNLFKLPVVSQVRLFDPATQEELELGE